MVALPARAIHTDSWDTINRTIQCTNSTMCLSTWYNKKIT